MTTIFVVCPPLVLEKKIVQKFISGSVLSRVLYNIKQTLIFRMRSISQARHTKSYKQEKGSASWQRKQVRGGGGGGAPIP